MSLYEYDEEKQLEMERNEAEERGEARGRVEGEKIGEARGRIEGEKIGEARGEAHGKVEGHSQGIELAKSVFKLSLAGKSVEEIAKECGITAERVKGILE